MASILSDYEYDVFISYRQNDNRSGWVTQFVDDLQTELASAFKEPVSVYFDSNPNDGLLETHLVHDSLEQKLRCIVFIPILSRTYCDPKSFAWNYELLAFRKLMLDDSAGDKIKLANGNVASRILPIRTHQLDENDLATWETAIGPLRAIDFIYRQPGVNRPLNPADHKDDNLNKITYQNQVNKVANAIHEIVKAMTSGVKEPTGGPLPISHQPELKSRPSRILRSKMVYLMAFLMAVSLSIYFLYPQMEEAPSRNPESIAVLYFDNMSGDPDQEYFSDGMTEEIISKLSVIRGLRVTSRTSVRPYKDIKKSAREIGSDLGVKSILEGSVRRSGDKVKITAQLINAATDEHFWSESFESEVKDVLQLQSEIAQSIARKFRIAVNQKTRDRILARSKTNPKAYDLYLRALNSQQEDLNYGYKRPQADIDISLLKQTIRLDPTFSEAYTLLGERYLFRSLSGLSEPEYYANIDSAKAVCQTGIAINPENAAGYLTLSEIEGYLGRLSEALQWALKAHELDPYAGVQRVRVLYTGLRNYRMAAELLEEGIKMDPGFWENYGRKASMFCHLGLQDSARYYLSKALRLAPTSRDLARQAYSVYRLTGQLNEVLRIWPITSFDSKSGNYNLGIAYFLNRDWPKADSLYRLSNAPDDLDAGCIAIKMGRKVEGEKFLKLAIGRRLSNKRKDYWNNWVHWDLARAYAMLGDRRYLNYAKRASDEGWHSVAWLSADPFFDPVRDTPEFKELEKLIVDRNEEYKRQVLAVFSKNTTP